VTVDFVIVFIIIIINVNFKGMTMEHMTYKR